VKINTCNVIKSSENRGFRIPELGMYPMHNGDSAAPIVEYLDDLH